MAEGNPSTIQDGSLSPSEEEWKSLLPPLTEEDNTSTPENTSPPSPSSTEAAGKEISIVLAGKSAAGKSSLARNILGVEEVEEASARPKTEECNTQTATKNGVTLKVTDTVGLIGGRSEELKKLTEHTKGKADILVYCIPVTLASRFEDGNPAIMKSLHRAYGPELWKHCILALTFSNMTMEMLKSRYNNEEAISEYKKLLKDHTEPFKQELEKLKVKEMNVETFFRYHDFSPNNHNTIAAIPVGWKPDDPVLPDFEASVPPRLSEEIRNWNDILFFEIIRKSKAEVQRGLLQYRYGPLIFDTIAATFTPGVKAIVSISGDTGASVERGAVGAVIGGLVGLPGGPVGVPLGIIVGAAIGAAIGWTRKGKKDGASLEEKN